MDGERSAGCRVLEGRGGVHGRPRRAPSVDPRRGHPVGRRRIPPSARPARTVKFRVQPCTAVTIEGRLARAIEFFDSAEDERARHPERANAWVTHYILAGIA